MVINTEHNISLYPKAVATPGQTLLHLPAFMEVWAMYAKDGHEQFYKMCDTPVPICTVPAIRLQA